MLHQIRFPYCHAQPHRKQKKKSATLTFDPCSYSEAPAEFTKPLEDQTVEEEATAELECEVSRENAEVTWYRDGQEIRKTKKYDMVVDGRKRKLVIYDCALDDSRTYTCDAKHFKTSAFLSVERKCQNKYTNIKSFHTLNTMGLFIIDIKPIFL